MRTQIGATSRAVRTQVDCACPRLISDALRWRASPQLHSVFFAVQILPPSLEGLLRLSQTELLEGQATLCGSLGDLFIDEGIVEPGCRRLVTGGGKINSLGPSPKDRPQAHGAGLAAAIDDAIGQLKLAQLLAGLPYGDDLSMGGGVEREGDLIASFDQHLPVLHNEGAKWTPSWNLSLAGGYVDTAGQKIEMLLHSLRLTDSRAPLTYHLVRGGLCKEDVEQNLLICRRWILRISLALLGTEFLEGGQW